MSQTQRTIRWTQIGGLVGAALLLGTSAQAMDDVKPRDVEARSLQARFDLNLRRAEGLADVPGERASSWRRSAFYRQGLAIPGLTEATGFRWAATPRALSLEADPSLR